MLSTCAIDDIITSPQALYCSLPATLHINASECPRPAWQHCCHRVFTCQILMNLHCVLCFLSRAWPPPLLPSPPLTSFYLPVHGALSLHPPPSNTTTISPTSPRPDPIHPSFTVTDTAVCVAAWPVAPDASPGTGPTHPRTTRALWARRSSRPA